MIFFFKNCEMLRIISKLNVRVCLVNQRLAQFCTVNNVHSYELDEEKPWNRLFNYFRECGRHKMFQRTSQFIYQFDDETRNLTHFPSVKRNIEWNEQTNSYNNDKLICAFEDMLNYSQENNIPLVDTQFDQFIDDFCKRMEQFTLNEVIRALQIFAKYPWNGSNIRQRNGIELYYAFDQACSIRSSDLLTQQLLFLSSIWLSIPHSKQTQFANLVQRILQRYMRTMSGPELAQSFLYINCWRKYIEDIRAFENIFENVLDDMTIEEVTTILWTFVRKDTKLEKQELRNKFIDYLSKQNLNQLNDSELSKILTVSNERFWCF